MKKILFPLLILFMFISVMPSFAQEREIQVESAQNNDGCMGFRIGVNSNKYRAPLKIN